MIALAGDRIPPVRRRSRFTSASEMVARLQTREGFSRWDPRVLDDYCTHGLRPSPNGEGFELACPPEVERALYVGQADADIYAMLRSIDLPVHIVPKCYLEGDRPVLTQRVHGRANSSQRAS